MPVKLPPSILLVDKPSGPTSHDVVARARRALRERRIGHTGTLDPMATGVMVLLIGRATRLSEYLTAHDKRYLAGVRFGTETDTYDAQGQVTRESDARPTREALDAALVPLRGRIRQRPPAYSAIHVDGVRAHKIARAGEDVDLPSRDVEVTRLEVLCFSEDLAELDVHCSSGTYIRSIAHDLGRALGCGAHLASLRRAAVGRFSEAEAISLDELERAAREQRVDEMLRCPSDGLDWPRLSLCDADATAVRHGRTVPAPDEPDDARRWCAMAPDGSFLAVMERTADAAHLRPVKVIG